MSKRGSNNNTSRRRSRLFIFLVPSLIIVLALFSGGVFYYRANMAPYRQTVLKVDNTSITMGYFLKRLKMYSGNDTAAMLQQLTFEQLVKTMAPQNGIESSPSDIDTQLRTEASIASENTTVVNTENATTEGHYCIFAGNR